MLWRRKTQFCQQCRKKFVKSQTLSRSKSQNDEKIMFFRENWFVWKMIPCTNRMQLSRACRTFPPVVRHLFSLKNKNDKRSYYTFQRKSNFSAKVPLYTLNAVLATAPKTLHWKCKNFDLKPQNSWKKIEIWSQNYQNCALATKTQFCPQ